MTTPMRLLALSAALALTGGAALAQQNSGTLTPDQQAAEAAREAQIRNYRPDPNSFIDVPPGDPDLITGPFGFTGRNHIIATKGGWRGARDCTDGKPKATPAPRVVRTQPAPGSTVRPGAMVLSVTFDRPMACLANLESSHFPLPCPDGKGAVIMDPDRRTLTTVCEVEAGSSYSMPIADFVGDGGTKSEPYDLAFTTSTEAPVTDVRQAGKLEKVGDVRR